MPLKILSNSHTEYRFMLRDGYKKFAFNTRRISNFNISNMKINVFNFVQKMIKERRSR